jgi:signal transduction histidine kinase
MRGESPMFERVKSLIASESLADFLERFTRHALEETRAAKGVLVLLQDFLLAEKKLTYIRLSGEQEEERGGFIYCSLMTETGKGSPSPGPHPMRKIMREALRVGGPVLVEDVKNHPVTRGSVPPGTLDFSSAVCLPIGTTTLSGLLYLDHTEKGRFKEQDVLRLELLAGIASLRLQHLLNFRYQFMLSQAITQFNTTLDPDKLIELVLNEFKLRLGFARVLFFRVKEDQRMSRLERSLPEELKEGLSPEHQVLPIDPSDSLCRTLFVERRLASLERLSRGKQNTLKAYINGREREIRNPGWIRFMEHMGFQPLLTIPIHVPEQVIGILACDKLGLPILLGDEGREYFRSLSEALAMALEKVDRYHDMKERLGRIYEERLRREALASLASLVKDLSHVISSPVRRIINASSTMDSELRRIQNQGAVKDAFDALKENVESVRSASMTIRTYVTYLRELARTEQLEPVLETSDLLECIHRAWFERVARFFPSVEMKILRRDPGVAPFRFDNLQVTSVLANLFLNAARAMRDTGGTIAVSTKRDENFVRISIEDEGPGIPEGILRDLFSLEKRISSEWPGEGTGTGLLICKEIVFRHKGNLEIHSTGGRHVRRYSVPVDFRNDKREKGTEVRIELPYQTEPEDSPTNQRGLAGVKDI